MDSPLTRKAEIVDDLVRRLHEQIDRAVAEQGTSDNRVRSRRINTAGNEWTWRQAQEDRGRELNAYAAEPTPICADDHADSYGLSDHQEDPE